MVASDVIFVLPYPLSDHPSFPEGILKRALEAEGFRVGVIETPLWQKRESFGLLGRPRLFFAVISGPMDSMVLNYTASGTRRREDLYQMEGKAFFEGHPPSIHSRIRPDRTTIVFSQRIRETFKGTPIIIGGIEASLRRFGHYDFHQKRVRRSILLDSRADILVTGMGEKQLVEIAHRLSAGDGPEAIHIAGIARVAKHLPRGGEYREIHSFEDLSADPNKLLEAHLMMEEAYCQGKGVVQRHAERYVVENPPNIYNSADINRIYGLSFTRTHPRRPGYSPALRMNLFSITSHRGCGGGCSFCAITNHEGKRVISRSMESVLREVSSLTRHPEWKGFVSDIGGPTAEMYGLDCGVSTCRRPSCLCPRPCPTLPPGERFLDLLAECRRMPKVKKVFVGSGIRYDLALQNPGLLEIIMRHHAGGFLRIAPEHTEESVLRLMKKPSFSVLKDFVRLFNSLNAKMARKIQLAPYVIVGHPGETGQDVREMKKKLKSLGLRLRDVQIFTPSPGTLATAMYHAECSPEGMPVPVEKRMRELQMRKAHLLEP
jgi:uncharacterized radical SAM protein YgiQ